MMFLRWGRPASRLFLDGSILALLLLAFAYWWQGNLVHEIVGTLFFVLLIRHLFNNGRWWSALRRGPYDPRRVMSLILTMLLAASMAVLLLTSLAISQSLFTFLPQPGLFTMREVHWFSAYWVMAIVGLHLGLNWSRITALLRNIGWMKGRTWVWMALGLLCAGALAIQGLFSAIVLGLWPRLRFTYSMTMWDFNEAVLPFFGHWLAVVGLFAVIGQVALRAAIWAGSRC
ncbi:DUF4405 domain-containing protein [Sulfitobacter pseudonitzschiae]|uniref:DUF4405 domain-containing protein n=1 Tax=Pseudosulfitobacter pseudonitzschiae TaxID=1402135 RepID=A0A9Q2NMS8_9RHOB|nr:DUF4405 domain-containing protein [Pseudosulfitobacter pseudonitzschiae]MBM2294869.1 DUF4405 domain-containing protein [Pseudosulfitobacter pseudonitzschiae]MBM2299949.1 DUF4405 domain-containing protein [Pseudosulfitobacter pseudonitzschiae]MBM2304706.1 DUF4405 domain-containing protein [Pseudosulfitobacter pseudonitzschiae]MBM2319375.1 DUF4405 domain-containing protein [Pseudosulfitobacter pseudonitzschiae]MBM2338603.1 DUF4405 domain-containing protein [Pseudosulfitobacter pseudonitzschia